jgi:hypothetical protein
MREYLHSLGVTVPLTASNYGLDMGTMRARADMDYVDNHSYWDHPIYFKGRVPPYAYIGESDLTVDAKTPRELFSTRIFGLPFAVTEFNFCYPNSYRAEGGPVMGAYAGLQDWDMLVRFGYSHNQKRLVSMDAPIGFDTAPDPVNTLTDRIISMLFLRGDVAPARNKLGWQLPADATNPETTGSFSSHFSRLGLVSAIGTVTSGKIQNGKTTQMLTSDEAASRRLFMDIPDKGAGEFDPRSGIQTSDTGEITIDREARRLIVRTPRSEVFVLNATGTAATATGHVVTIRKETANAVTVAVMSVDGQPLADSSRILILHLTDAKGTNATFSNQKHTIMEKWGEMPLLVRQGRAHLQLATHAADASAGWTLHALGTDGKRVGSVPVVLREGGLDFTLDVMAASMETPVFAYELTRWK